MRTLFAGILLVAVISAVATDWRIVDEWEVWGVTDDHAWGLTKKDGSDIYLANWHPDDITEWETNIFVYEEDGTYQGELFDTPITDFDACGVVWKGDSDHGGVGWYMGSRRDSNVFFVAEDGTSYTSFSGPGTFGNVFGVTYNAENDILYVTDWESARIAWGTVDSSGHVTSWNTENFGFDIGGLAYGVADGTKYLFGIERYRDGRYWDAGLNVWELDASGQPLDIYVPIDYFNFDVFYFPGGIFWDGDFLWMLNQNYDGATNPDKVTKIALPGYSDYLVNITPASLGNIKAQFR
ncbi:MAG: hypothetical protein JSW52_10355 [Candidatus Coatesbacteria bacterium]|nr:MAG: hypothetical protein JSW52_10355 [Candidatus Coatesbacteria bacterium]